MKFLLLAIAVLSSLVVDAQVVTRIEGMALFGQDGQVGLRDSAPGTSPSGNLAQPTPTPALPLSMRTIYRPFAATTPNPAVVDTTYQTLVIEGNALQSLTNNGAQQNLKLVSYASADCTAAPAVNGNAIPRNAQTSNSAQRAAYTMPVNPQTTGVNVALLETEGYWICVNPTGNQWIHTNLLYMVVVPCDCDGANCSTTHTAGIALSTTSVPTSCAEQAALGVITGDTGANPGPWTETGVNDPKFRERTQRTVCCGWRDTIQDEQNNPAITVPKRFGFCINPSISSCCDSRSDTRQFTHPTHSAANIGGTGKPFSPFREKCCFGGDQFVGASLPDRGPGTAVVISYLHDSCPCQADNVERWCGQTNLCCTQSKYPELLPKDQSGNPDLQFIRGRCYDPNEHKCCNTGEVYDAGSMQCCPINGLQSVNVPCPCGANTDCGPFQTCCVQTMPAPIATGIQCSSYLNYPSGQGFAREQACPGQCIDTRYQICCNGVACIDNFETCCNATCCNKFNEYCTMGLREGAANQFFNSRDLRVPFEVCTSIEALTPERAVTAYLLPIALLVATYLGLAATLFFAKRINTFNPISAYEKLVYALAIAAVIFGWPLFFSPLYKYGLVIAFGAFFAILAALSGIRPLMLAAIFVQGLVLLYLFDPFYGNELLTFSYHRATRPDGVGFNGVLHSIRQMWDDPEHLSENGDAAFFGTFPFHYENPWGRNNGFRCSDFYFGFFARDRMTEDPRVDNPAKFEFGLCSRGWFTTLLVLTSIEIIVAILLFVAILIAQVKNVLVKKAVGQAPIPYY